MKEAMEVVSSGKLSYRKTADIASVPKDALHRRVNNKLKLNPSKQCKNILEKFLCVLSTKQQKELKPYLKNIDGFTIMNLRILTYKYCTRCCIPHPFNKEKKMTGRDFVSGFLKRSKDLSLRKSQGVVLNRICGLNKTDAL